jgi:hypothetical protein
MDPFCLYFYAVVSPTLDGAEWFTAVKALCL